MNADLTHHRHVLLLGVLLLALAGCKSAAPATADDADKANAATISVEAATASERPMHDLLDLSGSFAPSQGASARLTPAVAGRISKVLVKEGEHVRAGQLLAVIDQRVQVAQQNSAAAGAVAARAQAVQSQFAFEAASADLASNIRSAEIAFDQAKLERDSSVAQAELALDEARADMEKLRAGARPQEIAQAHELTVQAQAARDRAKAEYRRNQELAPDGYVSRRQVEDAKTALDTAESAWVAARANESLVREGARREEIRAQEAHTAALAEALDSARSIGSRRVDAAASALKQAREGALALRAKLKDVEAGVATAHQKDADAATAAATTQLGEIHAPFNGVITRRNLNTGDFADNTTTVLEITSLGAKTDFVASALPSQAIQVHPGMEVEIDSDPPVPGHILSVSPADPLTGLATIRAGCETAAFTGAFATCHVILHDYKSVIAVPSQSVLDRDGKTVVYKIVDGVAKQLEVQAGPEEDGFTAILSGVKKGDQVVQLGSYEMADGAKVKVAEKPAAPAEASEGEKKESGS